MDVTPGVNGPGTLLAGRYEVGPLIGLGGTAQVYRAWDRDRCCAVAVKVFRPGSAVVPSRGSSWELTVLTDIRHPGLVGVHDSGVDAEGCPFVVMDLVDGDSLAARLHGGPLPVDTVARLGVRLADTLAAVHRRGVVHRDVKPANVLLDAADRPWLTDFGIARIVDATRVTATGVVVGTAAYMAPEQVRGEAVGPPADVYALGLVLLEAATGHREYEGGALESALARLHRRPAVPAHVPEPLAATVSAMTEPEAGDRPTAAAVAEALRGIPAPADGRRATGRRLVPVGALACLVAAALGGAVTLAGADGSAAPQTAVVARAAPPAPAAVPPPTPVPAAPDVADGAVPATAQPVPVALRSDRGSSARAAGARTPAAGAGAGAGADRRPESRDGDRDGDRDRDGGRAGGDGGGGGDRDGDGDGDRDRDGDRARADANGDRDGDRARDGRDGEGTDERAEDDRNPREGGGAGRGDGDGDGNATDGNATDGNATDDGAAEGENARDDGGKGKKDRSGKDDDKGRSGESGRSGSDRGEG